MKLITSAHSDRDTLKQKVLSNARHLLKLDTIDISIFDMYEFFDVSADQLNEIEMKLFSDVEVARHIESVSHEFRYHPIPGQYNERQVMVEKQLKELLQLNTTVHHSTLIQVFGVNDDQFEQFKSYVLNPMEFVEIPLDYEVHPVRLSSLKDLDPIDGFINFSQDELKELQRDFSLDLDDLMFIQDYFKQINREPNTTELKALDTYWSDHCRHTTFETHLTDVRFEDGFFVELFKKAFQGYQELRNATNRSDRAMTLMDLGTIQARYLKQEGLASDVVVSDEVNACAVHMTIQTPEGPEAWILYFKNETHNHPTEIEPFGGAATCLGGAIRDTLSGRSYAYQAMRISGSKDASEPIEQTLPGKLPQSTISQKAVEGYSDYGNQIGIAQTYAKEYYHEGFVAKRLEAGAIVAATPADYVVRENPIPGDQIILLGGRTGKDGLGAAVGSSMVQEADDTQEEQSAQVQKGAPSTERKIVRLFRNPEVTRLIKKSNDFGAGGLSVAVGELADGIHIDLDAVKLKYPQMHGGEIALSESQERMAVVVAAKDVEQFLALCQKDDVEATVVAEVTQEPKLKMTWQDRVIFNIDRSFLNSNGATKQAQVEATQPQGDMPTETFTSMKEYVQSLNNRSQRGMVDYFDSTISAQTVLSPYGGRYELTPELGMVSLVPHATTTTVSAMTASYDPHLMTYSPFHGAYYAVIDSIARLAALGLDYKTAHLSMQEYFERLGENPSRWGKPFLALLGANLAMTELQIPAIGGKDSMSGSYEEIDVPPTLISFAVGHGEVDGVISRAFKQTDSKIILVEQPLNDDLTIDMESLKETFETIYNYRHQILASSTVSRLGLLKELIEMSYGNRIGFHVPEGEYTQPLMGSFVLEVAKDFDESVFNHVTVLGNTQEEKITIGEEVYSIEEVANWAQEPLEEVYHRFDIKMLETDYNVASMKIKHPKIKRALLPILTGVQSEQDYVKACELNDIEVTEFVFETERMTETIQLFSQLLDEHDLLIIPHGAAYGNEPNAPGKAWELLLTHPLVKERLNEFVKEGYLLATGTAVDALLSTGLIEFGQVKEGSNYRLVKNPMDKFLSRTQTVKILGSSIFTDGLEGELLNVPVASSWLGIDLNGDEQLLAKRGQIISVFEEGFDHQSIDGIQDETGHIIGFISNIERVAPSTLINSVTQRYESLFNQLNKGEN